MNAMQPFSAKCTSRISRVVYLIAGAALAVHLYASGFYGYFTDELYYLACSRHLAWGYADQPPLIAILTAMTRVLLGTSLRALRILPTLAAAAEVIITGKITAELGGKRFAQGLAALGVLVAPGILSIDGFLSMNAFEPLIWMGCAWLVIRIVKTGNERLWIWAGVLAGIGLENKYSMLIFGAGLVVGLLLTPERRILASKWPWIGILIALAIFLPNLIWNVREHFPFLEIQENIRRSGRDVALGPIGFFGQEILDMQPLSAPVWMAGLWFFFATEKGKQVRVLGWAWVFTALVIVVQSPRVYYLFPAFPLLFAGGAVMWEQWRMWKAWLVAMAVTGAIFAPLALPLLPPETYISYTRALHIAQPAIENHRLGPLPQIFADQFGWEEMTAEVARAYHALPENIRPRTAIFGQNYGQAGAIDFFGPKYGLPAALSTHQNYYLWGPRGYTGESMIIMGDRQARLEKLFISVEKVGHAEHPYSMPYQHFDIFWCRGMKKPLSEIWPEIKNWD